MKVIDIFEGFNKLKYKHPERKNIYLKRIRKKAAIYLLFLPGIVCLYLLISIRNRVLFRKREVSKKMLIGQRYVGHLNPESSLSVVMDSIYNIRQFFFKKNVLFIDYEFVNFLISVGLKRNSRILDLVISGIKSRYQIRELIFFTDYQPLYKAIINSAKNASLKTTSIQHGIYSGLSASKYEIDGNYVDQLVVYDKYQKNICIEAGIDKNKIVIGGIPNYFYCMKPSRKCVSHRKTRICILGSGYGASGKQIISRRINNAIYRSFSLLEEFDVYYKPHPLEISFGNIEIDEVDSKKIVESSFCDMIDDFDVFIGIGSTTLLQATVNKKIAIQIIPIEKNTRVLSDFGYCYSFYEDDFSWVDKIRNLKPLLIETTNYECYINSFVLDKGL